MICGELGEGGREPGGVCVYVCVRPLFNQIN